MCTTYLVQHSNTALYFFIRSRSHVRSGQRALSESEAQNLSGLSGASNRRVYGNISSATAVSRNTWLDFSTYMKQNYAEFVKDLDKLNLVIVVRFSILPQLPQK